MSEAQKTVKFAAIYAVGAVLQKAASFLMLPIYTRYLTPEDYGTIELLNMTVDIFALVIGFGIANSVYRFYYRDEDVEKRNQVISTSFILLILCHVVGAGLGIASSGLLSGAVLDGGHDSVLYFHLSFINFGTLVLIILPLVFIRALQRPIFFVTISLGRLVFQIGLNVLFVVVLQKGVLGVLMSSLINNILFGIWLLVYTFRKVGFSFSKTIAKEMLIYGAPLIISNLGAFVLTFSDRYFLKTYSDLTTVGIYSLGYKLGFVLWMLAGVPINNIWAPQRFEIAKQPNAQAINRKVFFFYNLVFVSIGLFISLFSRDLFRVMSAPSFWPAYKIVPFIMLAYIIQAWTAFCDFGVFYAGKTKHVAIGTVASAGVIIALSFALIPTYQALGAALATIFAFFVRFVYVWLFSQKYYELTLNWKRPLMMLAIASVLSTISMIVDTQSIGLSIVLQFSLFALYILLVWVLPILHVEDKKTIVAFIRNPMQFIKGKS
ncbi:MAG: oligosaccharide flippase family protein [Myxococcota bacterium]|nr:oligosaccharide flippase family protein [Myxococcota bacterium]